MVDDSSDIKKSCWIDGQIGARRGGVNGGVGCGRINLDK